jgi:hypothetical protein
MNLGHHIQCRDISILVKKFGCMERLIREAMDIGLYRDNMNSEEGFLPE